MIRLDPLTLAPLCETALGMGLSDAAEVVLAADSTWVARIGPACNVEWAVLLGETAWVSAAATLLPDGAVVVARADGREGRVACLERDGTLRWERSARRCRRPFSLSGNELASGMPASGRSRMQAPSLRAASAGAPAYATHGVALVLGVTAWFVWQVVAG